MALMRKALSPRAWTGLFFLVRDVGWRVILEAAERADQLLEEGDWQGAAYQSAREEARSLGLACHQDGRPEPAPAREGLHRRPSNIR